MVVVPLIVVLALRVLAPVEVTKVPVLPAKVFAPEPEAVNPPANTGVVSVQEVPVDAPVKVLAASVLATVKAASGSVMVRAAVGPENVICWPKIGRVLLALGSVVVIAPRAPVGGERVRVPLVAFLK